MPLRSKYPELVIPNVSFSEYMLAALRRNGERIAIIEARSGRRVTFSQISQEAIKLASALARTGLRKGDMIAICVPNCCEYVTIILAVAACGATITTCNPLFTFEEMKNRFEHSSPKMVFTSSETYQKVLRKVAENIISIKRIFTIDDAEGLTSYRNLVTGDDGTAFPRNVSIDPGEDVLFMPYSSGTTGLPKGVMLTHRAFISGFIVNRVPPLYNSDCHYLVIPMFHMFGLVSSFAGLDQGHCQVFDTRFDVEWFCKCVEKYKITRVSAVPPMLLAMAKSPILDEFDLSSLVSILCSATSLPPEIPTILRKRLAGATISQGYGLTEGLSVGVTDRSPVAPDCAAGRIAPNASMKVIDIDTGKELGPYKKGELCFKGPQCMKGYFNNPESTRKMIDADGWLHTGDIGYYDDNELFYVVDRLKDLIKYKGFQVAPAEIEALLISHPKIADVAVVGVPDVEAGEVAKAYIVPIKSGSLSPQDVYDFMKGKVSKYKYLHGGIEFRTNIEKTASGKILRRRYRDEAAGKAKI